MLFFTVFNIFASVSRLIWVFAKDKGLPFSRTFAYAPLSLSAAAACWLSSGPSWLKAALERSCSCLYRLRAHFAHLPRLNHCFQRIMSLQALALSFSYLPPVTFYGIRRMLGTAPAPGFTQWARAGCLPKSYAFLYLICVIVWMPFPQFLPVDGTNMNYAGPMLIVLCSLLYWIRLVGGKGSILRRSAASG